MGLLRALKGVSTAAGAELPEPPKAAKPEQNKSTRRLSWSPLGKGSKDTPARPEGVQTKDEASEAGGGEAASALGQLLRRAVGCDDKLRLLDLSEPALGFARMPMAKQLASLGVLAKARAVQAVWLPGLELTDAHAPALAALLREHRTLQALCLERNGLTEQGLLQIAAAASGHPSLNELRVEEQKRPLSGTAAAKLQGLLHGRNSPTASSSNGRPQSPLAVAAAAAAAFAGASNRRPRRRSSKSDVGNSFVTSTPAVCYDV